MDFDILGKELTEVQARNINSLTLAFIGDSIYEIIVRTHIVKNTPGIKVNDAHRRVIEYVKATAQCRHMKSIEHILTDDELGVYKRGRNCKSISAPKSANITEYRVATGFEALIGYLYLIGKNDRINEIMEIIMREE